MCLGARHMYMNTVAYILCLSVIFFSFLSMFDVFKIFLPNTYFIAHHIVQASFNWNLLVILGTMGLFSFIVHHFWFGMRSSISSIGKWRYKGGHWNGLLILRLANWLFNFCSILLQAIYSWTEHHSVFRGKNHVRKRRILRHFAILFTTS